MTRPVTTAIKTAASEDADRATPTALPFQNSEPGRAGTHGGDNEWKLMPHEKGVVSTHQSGGCSSARNRVPSKSNTAKVEAIRLTLAFFSMTSSLS